MVGLSHFLPGGGAGPDASPTEKVYTVLSGELTVIVGGKETVLKPLDSCFIGPNENREIINRGNEVVTMLVAVRRRRSDAGGNMPALKASSRPERSGRAGTRESSVGDDIPRRDSGPARAFGRPGRQLPS